MDEYNRLTTPERYRAGLGRIYRYTNFVRDIEEITTFAWFRYLYWLRKKHKGVTRGSS